MALPAQAAPAPSENATVNLIRLLVQQGVIKQDQADALVAQAEAEAKSARATGNDRGAAVAQAGDVRVPYIPQTVRDQIRDEVKAEVMTQAKEENWAQPNTFPDWVSRITVEGDVRVRDESRLYSGSNSNEITDFARLNAKGPYDVNPQGGNSYPPMLNTREDRRNQLRVRARLGVRAELSESWTAGIRLATGSDDSPVSTSQTLGGGMSKKDIWLDQAYLTYRPTKWATVTGGRIGNPFDSTDMLFSNDLNFDGVAAIFKHPLQGRDVTLFGTLGAFSTEYSANGWNSSSFKEGKSEDNGCWPPRPAPSGRSTTGTRCAARWPTTTSTISRASAPAPARRGTATRTATPTGRVRPSCRRATRCSCCATSWPIRPTPAPRRSRSSWAWRPSSTCWT